MPDQWSKLLTKSAITREDYAKDPQAVLEVLEFYTDHQKRQQLDQSTENISRSTSASSSSTFVSDSTPPARFGGTGLAGAKMSPLSGAGDPRPGPKRQESAPAATNGQDYPSSASAAARAADLANRNNANGPQATRPAPPRPNLTATRPAPPAPQAQVKPAVPEHTPSSADLKLRAKAQGPPPEPGQQPPQRKESLSIRQRAEEQREREEAALERPALAPSKSSPATTQPSTEPAPGPAGATAGPPPVKPLQPAKKLPTTDGPKVKIQAPEKDAKKLDGSVAAAAAALEKPKEKEKRISTMTEVQIMEKLRNVVCDDDPKLLYSKIKKVGQG